MTCNEMNSKLPDLLLDPALANDAVDSHLADCGECREQLSELRATMALLDTWVALEPNPYFMTRLNARMKEEREAAPAGWLERLRARFAYGSRISLRPVAAMAMTAVLLVGGGTYLGVNNWDPPVAPPAQTAVVHDLQTLDNNAQLLDQLESLSDQSDD